MADNSKIEWTDASWNPVTGCTKVSPGCDHCYAETFAERFRGVPGHHFEQGFDVILRPERLDQPLRWRRGRRIFVNSMADLFHEAVPDEFIAKAFAVMSMAPQHTFQCLTKRHGRMRALLSSVDFQRLVGEAGRHIAMERVDGRYRGSSGPMQLTEGSSAWGYWQPVWPLPNVHVGVSVEDQKRGELRIPALLDTPAAVRFVSAEPLLGPVDLLGDVERPGPAIVRTGFSTRTDYGTGIEYDVDDQIGIDWLIVGGESGPGARPMDEAWARLLRDQCAEMGVPYFFKQAGTVLARKWGLRGKGDDPALWPQPWPQEFPTTVPS